MHLFTRLLSQLDASANDEPQLVALTSYFRAAPPTDAAWALHLLLGRKFPRSVSAAQLRAWAAEEASLPAWLIEESYAAVGDLSETLALVLPLVSNPDPPALHTVFEEFVLSCKFLTEPAKKAAVVAVWKNTDADHRFLFHKLVTATFRPPVTPALCARALAAVAFVDPSVMTLRLAAAWKPTSADFVSLLCPESSSSSTNHGPFPFVIPSPTTDPQTLGDPSHYAIEYTYDGVRAQLILDDGNVQLWSPDQQLLTARFPLLGATARLLSGLCLSSAAGALTGGLGAAQFRTPTTHSNEFLPRSSSLTLEGVILPWCNDQPLPRATLDSQPAPSTQSLLWDDVSILFMAFDLLQLQSEDLRPFPFQTRRNRLEQLLAPLTPADPIRLSQLIRADSWKSLAPLRTECRDRHLRGLTIKRLDAPYPHGSGQAKPGTWYSWNSEPFRIKAILVAAQPCESDPHLFSDLSFALRSDSGSLITIARAHALVSDRLEIDAFVKANITGKFGPVRAITPRWVFELEFDAVERSSRHRSGFHLRHVHVRSWLRDKSPADADTIATLESKL